MVGQPGEHDQAAFDPVEHQVITTWPVGTFVENIALLPSGDFAVTVHNRHEVHRVSIDGERHLWAPMPTAPAGVIAGSDGVFVVGGEPGQGPHHLYHVADSGAVSEIAAIPDTLFLNGFTPGPAGFGYAVDSIAGTVIAIEFETGASQVVIADERLQKISPEPMLPGANGIKAADGALIVTNTDRTMVLSVPVDSAGWPTGTVEVIAERLRGDDLAVATDGNLFIANHIHNTVIRLNPTTGDRVAVAGPDQGMPGSTACTFGPPKWASSLFVTTTGGIVMPWNGVVEEAKLVRLDVGTTGRHLGFPAPQESR